MSLNLYSLILKVLSENGQEANLQQIGEINENINSLIARGINPEWIKANIEVLI